MACHKSLQNSMAIFLVSVPAFRCDYALKRLCHEINILKIFFFKVYNNKEVLFVYVLIVFTIFCFLVDEKINLKEILPRTRLKDPKADILTQNACKKSL